MRPAPRLCALPPASRPPPGPQSHRAPGRPRNRRRTGATRGETAATMPRHVSPKDRRRPRTVTERVLSMNLRLSTTPFKRQVKRTRSSWSKRRGGEGAGTPGSCGGPTDPPSIRPRRRRKGHVVWGEPRSLRSWSSRRAPPMAAPRHPGLLSRPPVVSRLENAPTAQGCRGRARESTGTAPPERPAGERGPHASNGSEASETRVARDTSATRAPVSELKIK